MAVNASSTSLTEGSGALKVVSGRLVAATAEVVACERGPQRIYTEKATEEKPLSSQRYFSNIQ